MRELAALYPVLEEDINNIYARFSNRALNNTNFYLSFNEVQSELIELINRAEAEGKIVRRSVPVYKQVILVDGFIERYCPDCSYKGRKMICPECRVNTLRNWRGKEYEERLHKATHTEVR